MMAEIHIRKIDVQDVDVLYKWRNDVEIFRYLGGGYRPVSKQVQNEIVCAMIKDFEEGKAYRYIICLNDKPIGFIGLYDINKWNGTCELGIYIGEKDEWGKGYAKRACLLIENLAREIGLRKIKLFVVEDNIPAVEMYKKLSFRTVGVLIEERMIENKYHNVLIMEKFV